MTSSLSELKNMINNALFELYKNDHNLITNDAHEMACVFRFGIYFEQLKKTSAFNHLSVDCEYNRYNKEPKKILENFVRPDLIHHERGTQNNNLLIIEFKKANSPEDNKNDDFRKLKEFTSLTGEFKYLLGAYIEVKNEGSSIIYFMNGNNKL